MPEWAAEPGTAPAVITPRLLVVLDGPDAATAAQRVRAGLSRDDRLEAVLDLIIADGIAAAPHFVIAEFPSAEFDGDELVLVVRGGLEVTLTSGGNTLRPDGRAARTWRELRIGSVERLAVAVPGRADGAPASSLGLVPVGPESGSLAVSRVELTSALPSGTPTSAIAPPAPSIAPPLTTPPLTTPPPAAAAPSDADPGRTLDFVDALAEAAAAGPPASAAPAAASAAPAAVTPAALPPALAPAPPTVAPAADEAALYGTTIDYGVAASALRPSDGDRAAFLALDDSPVGITGVVCPRGHANPLERSTCRACGAPLTGTAIARVHRPDLGAVELPDGSELPLEGVILVGRSPRAEHSDGSAIPTLVTIDDRDVSRTHLRIRTEAWRVLVEDLGSTNGTILTETGGATRRLRVGEPVIVVDGMTASMGDGAMLTFRRVP